MFANIGVQTTTWATAYLDRARSHNSRPHTLLDTLSMFTQEYNSSVPAINILLAALALGYIIKVRYIMSLNQRDDDLMSSNNDRKRRVWLWMLLRNFQRS